jgi:chromosome segregation ATPase
MNAHEQQLKRIQEKLQALLKHHAALQKENGKLKEELNGLRNAHQEQQQNLDSLKQQVSILKAGGGGMSPDDKKEFERRINSYLKEIDRCIALLGE